MHEKQSHTKSSEPETLVRQKDMPEEQNERHMDQKSWLTPFYLHALARQPYMRGASTVHATNYDSWRENEREREKCSTNTETH